MKLAWKIAFGCVMLAACGPAQTPEQAKHDPISVQASAEVDVKYAMRDPDSAKVTTTSVDAQKRIVCGYVNAKNGFGGYGGNQPFIWRDGRVEMAENTPRRTFAKSLKQDCTGPAAF